MMNNTGPKFEPCGTPERITSSEELWLFNLTNCHFQIASNIQCYTELDSLSFQLNYGSYCIRHLLTKLLKSLRNIWNINGTTAVYRRLQQIIMCLYSITYSLSESCSPTGLMVQLNSTLQYPSHKVQSTKRSRASLYHQFKTKHCIPSPKNSSWYSGNKMECDNTTAVLKRCRYTIALSISWIIFFTWYQESLISDFGRRVHL